MHEQNEYLEQCNVQAQNIARDVREGLQLKKYILKLNTVTRVIHSKFIPTILLAISNNKHCVLFSQKKKNEMEKLLQNGECIIE